jgi:hypothetical protein
MENGILHFVILHFSGKHNKRFTPKLHGIKVLELIRKDFITKKGKLLFGLYEGYLVNIEKNIECVKRVLEKACFQDL